MISLPNPALAESPDLLIVLGKNIGIGSSPENIRHRHDHLSRESRINTTAAGELWTPGTDILFSGGQTAGLDTASEAAAMKDYFKKLYPNVPNSNLFLEEKSIDTAGNAEETTKFLSENHYKHIGLLTVGYHLKNARRLFENFGVNISETFAAEKTVQTRSPLHKTYITGWSDSKHVKREYKKEALRSIVLVADRKGRIVHLITTRSRR